MPETRLPFARWLARQVDRDDEVGDLARAVAAPGASEHLRAKDVRALGKRFHPEELEPYLTGAPARALRAATREWVDGATDETPAVVIAYRPADQWGGPTVNVRCPFCHEGSRHRRTDKPSTHVHGVGGTVAPRDLLSGRVAHCHNRSRALPSSYVLTDPRGLVPESVVLEPEAVTAR